ncbi:MAG: NAD(P)-dependent alcohol dehydrogenase [Armatimonadota bacterium]
MRALRLHGPKDLRMHDEPIPQPQKGEVQIKIMSVGVCASDLHYYIDGKIGTAVVKEPIVIGHEASGLITAVGEGVTDIKVGDRVAIEPAKPCMVCEYCQSGNFNVCPDIPFFGTPPTDGCLRDYITWPSQLVVKAPDNLSYDEIAMIEPLAVGFYAVELSDVRAGETAVIIGAGAIGLSVLQALRIHNIGRVIVSEPVAERRNAALKLGADEVVNPNAGDLEEQILALTDGRGADFVVECAGESDTVKDSCKIARVLGRVIVVGIPYSDEYPFAASYARRKQLSAIFVRRSNLTTEDAMEMAAEGRVDVASFATHRFPLEKTVEAMEMAYQKKDGVIRAIIAVNE